MWRCHRAVALLLIPNLRDSRTRYSFLPAERFNLRWRTHREQ
jgi:hypothetical protein